MKILVLLLIACAWIPQTTNSAEFNWNDLVLTYLGQGPDIMVQYCANEAGELILLVISKGPEGSSLIHEVSGLEGSNIKRGSRAHIESAGKIHLPPNTEENFAYVENGVVYRGSVKLKKANLMAYVQGYVDGLEKGRKANP